jgi:hypothetical protein
MDAKATGENQEKRWCFCHHLELIFQFGFYTQSIWTILDLPTDDFDSWESRKLVKS